MIGQVIKQIRKENGLSQVELANLIHVGQNTISQYETGARSVDLDILFLLSKKLKYNMTLNETGVKLTKINDETFNICKWCMHVIDVDINKIEECPLCKHKDELVRVKLELNDRYTLLKRIGDIILCESVIADYTPYIVWSISVPDNNNIVYPIWGKQFKKYNLALEYLLTKANDNGYL